MWKLHSGQVVHDSDVDEALGVLHDAEDGLKVWSPAGCTEGRRGALRDGGIKERSGKLFVKYKLHFKQYGDTDWVLPVNIMKCMHGISPTGRRWTACCWVAAGGACLCCRGWRSCWAKVTGSTDCPPGTNRLQRSYLGLWPSSCSCRPPRPVPSPRTTAKYSFIQS